MLKNGFVKVCLASLKLEVGNPLNNVKEIIKVLDNNKASIVLFPELSLTGYSCGDLFYSSLLLNDVEESIKYLLDNNNYKGLFVVGAPIYFDGSLYDCAIVIHNNNILGIVPKNNLSNSYSSYEKRWFKTNVDALEEISFLGKKYPFGNLIFSDNKNNINIYVEISNDLESLISPSSYASLNGANIILNPAAKVDTLNSDEFRRNNVLVNSKNNSVAYLYSSASFFESTSNVVYSGHKIVSLCGDLIKEDDSFSLESSIIYADIDINKINYTRRNNTNLHNKVDIKFNKVSFVLDNTTEYVFDNIDTLPFIPKDDFKSFKKISQILEKALIKRIIHTNCEKLIIGVSGGLDSTLALLVCANALKKLNRSLSDIIAVTMPGFGTSDRTKSNALLMMEKLGLTVLVKPIKEACLSHFELIGHDVNKIDITYENTQARMRTLILMNLANEYNGIVIGTGDASELALGWCTYNGDQMSMYGINGGLPKTLVRYMVSKYAINDFKNIKDTLDDIVDTPISPELSGTNQRTEDSIGKYEINDFILYRHLVCGDDKDRIVYLLKIAFNLDDKIALLYVDKFFSRFFSQQFKRKALPDGPKVLDISLSPSDYILPSDIKR